MEAQTNTPINPALMSAGERHEWALSVARRMMANKRQIQAETLTYFQEHPEELAEIKTELRRLKSDQLIEK